ncbi:hypothetical protein VFPPC_16514 [Pochonia chlamydosporia 170]|uniref:Uncharacterized protein n=1 Tax=Pochonia chlamydosporia 170 TaxID=1380566 RepID=A0A179F7Q5_METCM|nr:hypothetical protein VFPPC_16514 [Pochonia chlamydosporia 170]OAQ61458.1 hypothetical protein VFPPC_16514 [Pochonia chlamydosporia 170]
MAFPKPPLDPACDSFHASILHSDVAARGIDLLRSVISLCPKPGGFRQFIKI